MIVARISRVEKTKRTPASSDRRVSGAVERSTGRSRMPATSPPQTAQHRAVRAYAHVVFPVAAMMMPPSVGPDIDATCQPLLFQVTALASASGGTSWGNNDHRAGALQARPMPTRNSSA